MRNNTFKVFLDEREFNLLLRCLWFKIENINSSIRNNYGDNLKLVQLKERLVNLVGFINDKSINIPECSIIVDSDSLLDIVDSIFSRVEELNYLIINNRTMQYPTDQYECSKSECISLYDKLMDRRF